MNKKVSMVVVAMSMTVCFAKIANAQILPYNHGDVTCINHDDKNIYVGCFNKGVFVIDRTSGLQSLQNTVDNRPRCIEIMKDGDVYIASLFNKEYNVYRNDVMETISHDFISGNYVAAFEYNPASRLQSLIATHIMVYNLAGKFSEGSFAMGNAFMTTTGEFITDIKTDKKGNTWVASRNANYSENGEMTALSRLIWYGGEEGGYVPVLYPEDMNVYAIEKIDVDDNNVKWLATDNGLYAYDDKEFRLVGDNDALVDLCVDGNGNVWFVSSNYLACYDGESVQKYELPEQTGDYQYTAVPHLDVVDNDVYVGYGSCLYKFEDGTFNKVEIDKSVGINEVSTVADSSIIYDLQGRKLNGELRQGVYVENGKAVLK